MTWLWLAVALACPPDNQVAFADVRLVYHLDGDSLHAQLHAPGPGWVAVGFNDQATLDGSRLLMFAIVDGEVVGEEHRAEPPNHRVQRVIPRDDLVGRLDERGLLVSFEVPAARADVPLARGQEVWLTLAWSQSPDFGHHSAGRAAQWVRL